VATDPNVQRQWLLIAALVILAIAAVAAIGFGAIFYTIAIEKWIDDGFTFKGWGIFDWLAGLIGAGIIHAGLLLAGLALRFSWLAFRARASLILAIVTVPYILLTYTMLVSPMEATDYAEQAFLLAGAILSLAVLTLPPFLVWKKAALDMPRPDDTGGPQS
jgi:hypothetical protein